MEPFKPRMEPNLSPTDVKRQHYVPQVFLRSFCEDGKLRVIDLETNKEFTTSTLKAAVQNQYYDLEIGEFQLSTEDWLSQIESSAAPIFKKLIGDPSSIISLSTEEEVFLSRFFTALRFRTPAFRQFESDMISNTLTEIKDMAKKQLFHQYNNEEATKKWNELMRKPDHWWFSESKPPQPAEITNFMLSQVQGFANILRAAPWRIGLSPGSMTLYTSDNPVSGYFKPVHPWWEGAAFGSLSYHIPLSPKVLLIIKPTPDRKGEEDIRPQGDRIYRNFSDWEVSFTRHIVTSEANRYLYGFSPIINKENAVNRLQRIGNAQIKFAMEYLGFSPYPPRSM